MIKRERRREIDGIDIGYVCVSQRDSEKRIIFKIKVITGATGKKGYEAPCISLDRRHKRESGEGKISRMFLEILMVPKMQQT